MVCVQATALVVSVLMVLFGEAGDGVGGGGEGRSSYGFSKVSNSRKLTLMQYCYGRPVPVMLAVMVPEGCAAPVLAPRPLP